MLATMSFHLPTPRYKSFSDIDSLSDTQRNAVKANPKCFKLYSSVSEYPFFLNPLRSCPSDLSVLRNNHLMIQLYIRCTHASASIYIDQSDVYSISLYKKFPNFRRNL